MVQCIPNCLPPSPQTQPLVGILHPRQALHPFWRPMDFQMVYLPAMQSVCPVQLPPPAPGTHPHLVGNVHPRQALHPGKVGLEAIVGPVGVRQTQREQRMVGTCSVDAARWHVHVAYDRGRRAIDVDVNSYKGVRTGQRTRLMYDPSFRTAMHVVQVLIIVSVRSYLPAVRFPHYLHQCPDPDPLALCPPIPTSLLCHEPCYPPPPPPPPAVPWRTNITTSMLTVSN